MLTEIAQGGDIADAAADRRRGDRVAAQRLDSSLRRTRLGPPSTDCDDDHRLPRRAPRAATRSSRSSPPPVAPRRRDRRCPYWLLLPSVAVLVVMLGYPALPPGRAVGAGVRARADVRCSPPRGSGLDNFRELLDRRLLLDGPVAHAVFCAVNVALTMVLGVLIALLLNSARQRRCGCCCRHVADPRLGDAGRSPPRSCGSGSSTPSTASSTGRFDRRTFVARRADVVLHGGDDHRGLDGHPVRRLHHLRRAQPDPHRADRGRPASTAPAQWPGGASSSSPRSSRSC